MPKVSVVMPLYNAEKYVKEAIESILNQTYEDFELIMVDDCSTDGTMQVVATIEDERIRILRNDRNRGIAYSRNRALSSCTGEYIALMDDDDIAARDRFEKQVDFLDTNADIDVVGGRCCTIDSASKVVGPPFEVLYNPRFIKAVVMFRNVVSNGSAMFRRDFVMQNQIQYREECLGMEDYHFWIDCSLHGNITNMNEIFLYWRESGENETSRVMTQKKNARAQKYMQLQRFALKENGFELAEEELVLLNKLFPEDDSKVVATVPELEQLYKVFQKMMIQAMQKDFPNKEEILILCRKQFTRRVETCELWMKSYVMK